MLGATEFTVIGNILMGVMAIGGFCAMLYAVGSAMSGTNAMSSDQWKIVERTETQSGTVKKAA